ncbi:MAG TPA: hypothetical protein VE825_13675 [Terriglobales bacterium]|nr:hypothetical protein [Terriglobales bacterium]
MVFLTDAAAGQGAKPPQHLVQDWSTRHVVFTGLTQESAAAQAQADPRAWNSWLAHAGKRAAPLAPRGGASAPIPAVLHRHAFRHLGADWNMALFGRTDPRFSPAKFSFDINAAPDCSNDYVVFPTTNTPAPGQSGGGTSPSLVAFNNLYTGPGPTGICPTPLTPSDQPSVLFAYNTATTTNGAAHLSPALSLDGKKIAFVESNDGFSNDYTAFHVLTWKAGEGSSPDAAALPGDCAAGNSCMTTLVLSNTRSDHNSSPFIDYANDAAYVADDGGILHKITPVFGGAPAEVTTGGWPLSMTVFGGQFGSPVLDSVSQRIFLTDNSSGALWVVDLATVRVILVQPGYITVADPVVDSSNETVLVVGCNGSVDLVVDQFDTSGNRLQRVDAGALGGNVNVYTGAFDNNYFTDPTTGFLYFAGSFGAGAELFRVGFTAGFPGIQDEYLHLGLSRAHQRERRQPAGAADGGLQPQPGDSAGPVVPRDRRELRLRRHRRLRREPRPQRWVPGDHPGFLRGDRKLHLQRERHDRGQREHLGAGRQCLCGGQPPGHAAERHQADAVRPAVKR